MSGWIKCSERMPEGEASGWILVFLENGETEMALWDVFDGFTDGDLYSFSSDVTHWQPLSPPPQD